MEGPILSGFRYSTTLSTPRRQGFPAPGWGAKRAIWARGGAARARGGAIGRPLKEAPPPGCGQLIPAPASVNTE
jgi:hypothetical protein